MVILDVQLWELGAQRLHQGLSETILVKTLTDVREFKKKNVWKYVKTAKLRLTALLNITNWSVNGLSLHPT